MNIMSIKTEHELLLRETSKIVDGLAQALAPLYEVVLHDLRDPDHAIVKIENNLSGRSIGGPATEIGLARIADPNFADLLIDYPNQFQDGRAVKSSSIGIKDSNDKFVFAICLNMDVSYLQSFATYLNELTQTIHIDKPKETLGSSSDKSIETIIHQFAIQRNKDPRSLSTEEKKELIKRIQKEGLLERRGAANKAAEILGGSRSSIYYYLNDNTKK